MEKIANHTHPTATLLYAVSRTLERTSYYGLRSLIVMYMINGILKMDDMEAIKIYGWLTSSLVISQIIGALLGDLAIGNKKALIIGAIVQSLGAFSLCIPSTIGLYIGLSLVVLGGGLYTPNIISSFGKLYLDRTKLLDAGFTLFYFVINIGAFVGVLAIGYVGEEYKWNLGFVTAGILMLLSIVPILFSKENRKELIVEKTSTINKSIPKILIVLTSVSVFWAIYELGDIRFLDLQFKLSKVSDIGISRSMWSSFNSIFTIPISLLAITLWSYYYSSQFFKIMLGFIFGAFSFGILFLIPESPSEHHIVLYLISLLLLSISEIHIAPIVFSVLTQYTNPKYLAILVSLAFIPTRLFSFLIGLFNDDLYEKPTVAVLIGLIAMTLSSLGLIIYNRRNRVTNNTLKP